MALTGTPPYRDAIPLALFIRCPRCVQRFLVWTAEQEPISVEILGAYIFIDSRKQSQVDCDCGELLPLIEITLAEGVM
jgi:hypothetical protein